jgi:purine nucleosidase
MAAALMLVPEIADRDVTVVWIGGGAYEGFGTERSARPEFNLSNDILAANIVFASGVQVWQIPAPVYRLMGVSYAELYQEVYDCGRIGKYLVDQLIEFNEMHPHEGYHLEYRSLGDSPAVGVILNPHCGWWTERPAWQFRTDGSYDTSKEYRPIRVYNYIDPRFIMSDFFAKLRAYTELGH